jgi:hypothetical protein|tara:strand:+ start:258 stop:548 length:291 start_codon:yes stop_codon:yes gene_type:complete
MTDNCIDNCCKIEDLVGFGAQPLSAEGAQLSKFHCYIAFFLEGPNSNSPIFPPAGLRAGPAAGREGPNGRDLELHEELRDKDEEKKLRKVRCRKLK